MAHRLVDYEVKESDDSLYIIDRNVISFSVVFWMVLLKLTTEFSASKQLQLTEKKIQMGLMFLSSKEGIRC